MSSYSLCWTKRSNSSTLSFRQLQDMQGGYEKEELPFEGEFFDAAADNHQGTAASKKFSTLSLQHGSILWGTSLNNASK